MRLTSHLCIGDFRKANELKTSVEVSPHMIQQFKDFWQRFSDTPFRGLHYWLYTSRLFCTFVILDERIALTKVWPLSALSRQIMKIETICTLLDNEEYQFLKVYLLSAGRNTILQNICPQVYGLFTVKLAGKFIVR